jgi:hypothetical protein
VKLPPKRGNPLKLIAYAEVATLPFDFYEYLIRHYLTAFGIAIIGAKLWFLILYYRHSPIAWYIAFAITAAITPLSKLLIYLGAEPSGPRQPRHVLLDLAIVALLLVYQWCLRERYFRYCETGEDAPAQAESQI